MNYRNHELPVDRQKMIKELETLLSQHPQVEFIDAIIPDLNGYIRGKRFPIKDGGKIYTSGVQIPESTMLLDYFGDSSDPCGRGFSDGDPDGTLRPISGTTKYVPWGDGKKAQVLMRFESDDGSLCQVDPRTIAFGVVDQFNSLGYQSNIAFELEFYLLSAKLNDRGRPQLPNSGGAARSVDETQVYLLEDLDLYDDFLQRVKEACEIQGVPASVITSEYSPSQYEINLNHVKDPLLAADQCVLLKRVIKGVASDFCMQATFMPKPFPENSGNGMHIHLSLEDDKGRNLFRDKHQLGSALMRYAIGGLLNSIPDVFAVFAPGRNSYRRFVPDLYVPVNKTWGYNNRSVAVRIPAGDENARRLEHRIAGADANPYLVLAAILAGVHHGIINSTDPGEPSPPVNVSGEIDEDFPLEWNKAISVFQNSTFARSYFSDQYVEIFCSLKQAEHRQYEDHISDQEYLLYL